MTDTELTAIAEKIVILLQVDRMHRHIPTNPDMAPFLNIPAYLSKVFEDANTLEGPIDPTEIYDIVNKRLSSMQAQLYLMRLEMNESFSRDPASLYEDPLAISAYGERIDTAFRAPRVYSFEPAILAYGWHPVEFTDGIYRRWMRPAPVSVACVPHLGSIDQAIEISGVVHEKEQYNGFHIACAGKQAIIEVNPERATFFTARIDIADIDVSNTNYLPIEFTMPNFRQASDSDTRMVGASIYRFSCRDNRLREE